MERQRSITQQEEAEKAAPPIRRVWRAHHPQRERRKASPPKISGERQHRQKEEGSNRHGQGREHHTTEEGESTGDVRPHRFFVQLNPPIHDKKFSFTVHFVATNFAKKKTREACDRDAKKHEQTTVLNKQKRTICAFKCWLTVQLASVEALLSLAKTIDDPTPSWIAVPFCLLSFSAPYRKDSRLGLMRILHAEAHQRVSDPWTYKMI